MLLNGDLLSHLSELMSLHYLGKHEPGNCVFSVRHRHVFTHILQQNVGGSEQNRSVIANAQSDDLFPSRMHAATHILQEKTHACGILKRHNFWVHETQCRMPKLSVCR